ncbi:DUF7144 family membrane protein [Nocardiopsis potens]|uniref:DUF7144 family membrane protein n=1 Tax=Nocardiopsis potens TaxID=1246458 RepID=UPI00034CCB99|nr:hypothetical protein [Nocardiopsis potens]
MGGWRVFASCMLIFAGAVNLLQGMVASFNPGFYTAPDGEILVFDYAWWGVSLAVWGAVLLLAGFAALSGRMWARAVGVVAAGLNAFAQLAFLEAYPVWSVVALVVDGLVVYGLTAGWRDREAAVPRIDSEREAYRSGHRDADEAPVPGDETREPERPLHFGRHEQGFG